MPEDTGRKMPGYYERPLPFLLPVSFLHACWDFAADLSVHVHSAINLGELCRASYFKTCTWPKPSLQQGHPENVRGRRISGYCSRALCPTTPHLFPLKFHPQCKSSPVLLSFWGAGSYMLFAPYKACFVHSTDSLIFSHHLCLVKYRTDLLQRCKRLLCLCLTTLCRFTDLF